MSDLESNVSNGSNERDQTCCSMRTSAGGEETSGAGLCTFGYANSRFRTGAAGRIVVPTDSSADPGHTLSTLAIWVSARIRGHCAPRACNGVIFQPSHCQARQHSRNITVGLVAALSLALSFGVSTTLPNPPFVFRSQLRAYGQANFGLASEFSDHVGSSRELIFEASRNVTRVGSLVT